MSTKRLTLKPNSPSTPTSKAFSHSSAATGSGQNRHLKWLAVGTVLIAILGGGILGAMRYFKQQEEAAQRAIFHAIHAFEANEYGKAVQGNSEQLGFTQIITRYPRTKAGNLAHFYVGVISMHTKDYEAAMEHLKQFNSKDPILQARAWALIGDALCQKGAYEEAAKQYEKAAKHKPNKFFSPDYMARAAMAYEQVQQYEAAAQCYEYIIKEYAASPQAQRAEKHKYRVGTLMQRGK